MVQYAACNKAGPGGACTADSVIDIVNRAIPYYLSALAVAIGFRMALFNIGVEGQYRLAAVVAAIAGVEIHLPAVLQIPLLILVAMAVGAVWAGIAGLLKVTRGVSEVISTIMLNYIAYGLIAFILSSYLGNGDSSNLSGATPDLPKASQMPGMNRVLHDIGLLAPHDPDQVSGFLVVIAIVGTAFYFVVERSRFGFDLRASGINPFAAAGQRRLVAQDDPDHDAHLGRARRPGGPALPARPGLQLLERVPAEPRLQRHRGRPAGPQQAGRHRLRGAAVGFPRTVGADPRPQQHPAGDLHPDAGLDRAGRRGRVRDRSAGQGAQGRTRGLPRRAARHSAALSR